MRRLLAGFGLPLAAAAVAVLTAASATLADSWAAFPAQRVVDPTGEFYVVVREKDRTVSFVLARRAEGSPRVEPLPSHAKKTPEPAATPIDVRPGDAVLAGGTLPQSPYQLLVSSEGHGFVALERYGALGGGDAVIVVDAKGKVRVRRTLEQLELDASRYRRTVSSLWWLAGGWIDDRAREVVVLAADGEMRAVGLEDGTVRTGRDADLRRAIELPDPRAQALALEVAAERKVEGFATLRASVLADPGRDLAVRLRAARTLAEEGHEEARALLAETALGRGGRAGSGGEDASEADRRYAVEHLPAALGTDALPHLREILRGPAGPFWNAAQKGFVGLGEKAVPTLIGMLHEDGQSSDYRGGAAHALREVGSAEALPALLQAVADPVDYVANAAVNAAIATAKATGKDIDDELVALLARGTTQDGRLAAYFQQVRHPGAAAAVRSALARHPEDSYPYRALTKALAFQTADE